MEFLENLRITTKLRPRRIAVLIPDKLKYKLLIQLICNMSRFWGGEYTILIPTNGKTISTFFWDLLKKFDPDNVATPVHEEAFICKELRETLASTLCPFTFLGKDICYLEQAPYMRDLQTDIKVLLEGLRRKEIINLDLSDFPTLFQLLIYSITGKLDDNTVKEITTKKENNLIPDSNFVAKIIKKKYKFTNSGIYDLLALVLEKKDHSDITYLIKAYEAEKKGKHLDIKKFITQKIYSKLPFPTVMENLECLFFDQNNEQKTSEDYYLPYLIIVGNSVEDFCLYSNLSKLRSRVFWLPVIKFSKKVKQGKISKKESLWHKVFSQLIEFVDNKTFHKKEKIHLFSISQSKRELRNLRNRIVRKRSEIVSYGTWGGEELTVEQKNQMLKEAKTKRLNTLKKKIVLSNEKELLPTYKKYYEMKGLNIYLQQFVNQKSVNELISPVPRTFLKIIPYKMQWVTDVEIENYQLPQRKSLVKGHLHEQGLGLDNYNDDVRITIHGLTFHAQRHFYSKGWDLDVLLIKPQLEMLSIKEIATRIFKDKKINFKISDKGNYFNIISSCFSSLSEFRYFLINKDNRKVITKFLDIETKNIKGVFDEGVLIDKRRYLNVDSIFKLLKLNSRKEEDVLRISQILDEFLKRDLIFRGLILKCEDCLNVSWYSIDKISESFKCIRCGKQQKYLGIHIGHNPLKAEPELFYTLNETFFMFMHNNGDVTLFMLDKCKRESKNGFLFLPEINLYKNDNKIGEVDCFIIKDGKILIGEGKSSKEISNSEVKKYKSIIQRIKVDEVIFTTTQSQWANSAINKLCKLQKEFPKVKVNIWLNKDLK